MKPIFPFEHITLNQIEDMKNQLSICADKMEARRFDKLSFKSKQKVTVILRWREKMARKSDLQIDKDIAREVITDAQNGIFIFRNEVYAQS